MACKAVIFAFGILGPGDTFAPYCPLPTCPEEPRMTIGRLVGIATAVALAALPATALSDISGTVFNDYNSNGAKNAGGFVSGTTVTATGQPAVRSTMVVCVRGVAVTG